MRVSVFGLGYVGVVTAACLVRAGHEVVGVDIDHGKVELVGAGKSPVVEAGLDGLLSSAFASGRLSATSNAADAVHSSDVIMVTVGTPPSKGGGPSLSQVFSTIGEIAESCAAAPGTRVVVLRSTVPPGTLRECAGIFDRLGARDAAHLAFNPEFLREGSAIRDFDEPPYTVIGTTDSVAEAAVRKLYASVDAPVYVVSPDVAEMIKYVCNAWHGTKIAFANEVGRLAKALGLDGRQVMDLVGRDTKLNTSAVYMRPGFAYGGSCIPKDLAALLHLVRTLNVDTRLFQAVPASNAVQVSLAFDMVMETRPKEVGVLGLAFKPGTDDLRSSPMVLLVKQLLGEGIGVRVHDERVHQAKLLGTNLDYIRSHIPHFERLVFGELADVAPWGDALVVGHSTGAYRSAVVMYAGTRPVVDLVGLYDSAPPDINLHGIAW